MALIIGNVHVTLILEPKAPEDAAKSQGSAAQTEPEVRQAFLVPDRSEHERQIRQRDRDLLGGE